VVAKGAGIFGELMLAIGLAGLLVVGKKAMCRDNRGPGHSTPKPIADFFVDLLRLGMFDARFIFVKTEKFGVGPQAGTNLYLDRTL